MRCRIFWVHFCSVVLVLLLGQAAYGQPYVDTGFVYQSPDNDTDLVIVRENYNASNYRQAVYFRVFDDSLDWEAVGGSISFSHNISIVDAFFLRDVSWDNSRLIASDSPWGVAGGNYSDTYRGLEPWDAVGPDSFCWTANVFSFDAIFRHGMDDFRLIVDYGNSFPDGAYMEITLNTGTNAYGFPYISGIQVGNLSDVIPGSGDFGEITTLRVPLTPGPEPITVNIDIKPGNDDNCINNNGNGVIPVAILGSADFDATQIDPSTCSLAGQTVKVVGKANKLLTHIEDVNGDGFDDLVLQIEDVDGSFEEGDGEATLNCNLYEEYGSTPIEGTDFICIVPPSP